MGKNQVTLSDLAKELGVSTATVSRALKDYPDISRETKKRVLALAAARNYYPNSIAASLRKQETRTIGVIIPEIVNHFFSTVIKGIMEVAYDIGYRVVLCQSDEDHEKEVEDARALLASRVDGLLVSVAHGTQTYEHFQVFKRSNIPIVFFDKVCDAIPEASRIVVNDYQGAFQAVEHLIEQGYQRITHVRGPLVATNAKNRLRGYMDAMQKHHLPVNDFMIIDGEALSFDFAEHLGKIIAMNKYKVDAIFAVTDIMAIGIMKGLKSQGFKIPEDVAVIGFNDWYIATAVDPPLSSVAQPGFEMGKKAAEMLIDHIQQLKAGKEPVYETVILPTELKIRQSTLQKSLAKTPNLKL